MFPLLLILFIVVPIVELAVIIQVGSYIGVWQTIVLLILDSLIGAVLVKREGRRAWDAFRRALAETRWPGDEVTQGALILFGGALLLTPGFVTDVVGLLAVIPPTRAIASRTLRSVVTPGPVKEALRIRDGQRRSRGDGGSGRAGPSRAGEVYDVEVVDVRRDQPGGTGGAGTAEIEGDGDGTSAAEVGGGEGEDDGEDEVPRPGSE